MKIHQQCPLCHEKECIVLIIKYDSMACCKCEKWIEEECLCGGNECDMFPKRTTNPTKEDLKNPNNYFFFNIDNDVENS
jgi:hypothetical protein